MIHKTIDVLVSDMVRVLGIDEQQARDTIADLIRNRGYGVKNKADLPKNAPVTAHFSKENAKVMA